MLITSFRCLRCPHRAKRFWRRSHGCSARRKGGNQALAAARAGATVHMAGAVGDDGMGDIALAGCTAAGVNTDAVAVKHAAHRNRVDQCQSRRRKCHRRFSGCERRRLSHPTFPGQPANNDLLLLQMEIPVNEMAQMISHANASFGQGSSGILLPCRPLSSNCCDK